MSFHIDTLQLATAQMQQQQFIRDDHGVTYRVGTLLGRGLFANTYTVRGEDGQEWIIKVSFTPQDVPPELGHLVKISRAVLDEQWKLLSKTPSPHLLAPIRHFISEDGRYCLVYQRNDNSITQLLSQINSVQDLLRFVTRCTIALANLPSGLCPHGNIHPNNIFWNGKNIQFMDPITPLLALHHQTLLQAKGFNKYTPPEHRSPPKKTGDPKPEVYTDTYALCLLLIGQLNRGIEEDITTNGLSNLLETNLMQSLDLYLQQSPASNPNFHQRVIQEVLRFLRRGLSVGVAPAPPFRFISIREVQHRLQSLTDLINPTISKVGPVLFGGPLGSQNFGQGEEVLFSCSIYTTPILEDHEDITCGAIIYDLDRDNQRVQDYDLWVEVSRAPDGKLRFQFGLEGLNPGHYQLIVGFQVNGSLAAPHSNTSEFQIVATPGYTAAAAPQVPAKTLQFTHPTMPTVQQPHVVESDDELQPTPDSDDAATIIPSRHPLLSDSPVHGAPRSQAAIVIPDLEAHRPPMTLPETEHAHLEEVLEPIHTPKLPLEMVPTTTTPSKASNERKEPSLRIVADNPAARPKVGALHASPFEIEIESLVLPQTETPLQQKSISPFKQEESIEELSEDGYTDEFSEVDDYTDGFSEGMNYRDTQEESSEAPPPDAAQPSTVAIPEEDAHDVFKDAVHYTLTHLRNDPFLVSIIVLFGVIMMLGTLVLFL